MNAVQHQHRWNNDRASPWYGWANWVPLADADKRPDARPGVYVLAVRLEDAQLKIPRLLGMDEQGVLDIGESMNLRQRTAKLAKCAFTHDATGHIAGWRYRYLGLHRKVRGELVIAWRHGKESYRLEAQTMAAYLNAFGELPPLNYKTNWSLLRGRHGAVVPSV